MFALTVCESNYRCRACATLQHMTIYTNITYKELHATTTLVYVYCPDVRVMFGIGSIILCLH